jgi:CxxC motif-containing protein (DUF1111 family)
MEYRQLLAPVLAAGLLVGSAGVLEAQNRARDPGLRGGAPGAGGPIAGLTEYQRELFTLGLEDFSEAEDVADGLGPRMNLDSCGGCHAHPAVGGTSPAQNPQVAFARKDGGTDRVPSFVTLNGPIREARFVRHPDGSPDGGVAALFTITGREGADGCSIRQPDFAGELSRRNVIFRIPTPLFGAGLIEQIADRDLLANQAANQSRKRDLGVRGRPNFVSPGNRVTGMPNRNGNDGTIARFGWKGQNISLLLFSGEAYNVEMGITSELFQVERDQTPECQLADVPNDVQNFEPQTTLEAVTAIQNFANFQRFLAPPAPAPQTESTRRGRVLFEMVGCGLCHTPTLRTSVKAVPTALRNQPVHLFSDLMLHDMGEGLADGVAQGQAGPREFRTAPLWGLGQRIFFLHDGRTSDLAEAIQAHRSSGSEANRIVDSYNRQNEREKQDMLNFLRSL